MCIRDRDPVIFRISKEIIKLIVSHLDFWSNSDSLTQTVSYCNVIGNKCETDNNQVLFSCWYTTNVDHCVFLRNTAKDMFQQYYYSSTLTISESYVDPQSVTSTVGSVTFTDLKQNYNLNPISNFYTENCFIDKNIISNNISYLSKFSTAASSVLFSSKK